ncbi:hypothetical protein EOA33_14695, partial [Mesorhizobium sp. M4A.F.Ca.ET.050.02.1.1]
MATININGTLVNDQTAGVQFNDPDGDDVAISVDAGGDISGSLDAAFLAFLNGLTLSDAQKAFADSAEAASQSDLIQVTAGANEVVDSLIFAPLTNANSGLDTVGGQDILLTTSADGKSVLATAGVGGPIVAAFYIIPADADNLSATVQMVTFEAIAHPSGLDPDDRVDFSDILKVRALSHTDTPIGDDINVDDDGPDVNTNGAGPDLTVDESFLGGAGATTTGNFLANFPNSFGTDGAGALTFALGIPADATDSGFVDTASQEHIFLYKELDGSITGRVGDGGLADANGAIAFTVSVNTTTAVVTLTQSLAMVHNVPGNGTVPPGSYDEAISLAATLVTLTAHSEDADGDDDFATLDIGDNLFFKDDGPSISAGGTEATATVDESDLTTNGTANFSSNFNGVYGADGAGTTTYALSVSGVASGLLDTLTGQAINLSVTGGVVEGRTAVSNALVFTVTVDATTGIVTLNQDRAVIHDPNSGPNDTETLLADALVQLTATITDGDGDTDTAVLDIGQNLVFTDDAPTIVKPFDADPGTSGIQTPETLQNVVGTPASGDFKYSIGADGRQTYDATHSDFGDADLVAAGIQQLVLTGTVDNAQNPNITNIQTALTSETATSATFSFSFHYDKDPITANVQDATAGGTLTFDKVAGTYSIQLNDVIDGFSFNVFHSSELLTKAPPGNTGHPELVVTELDANPNTPADHDGFYV